MESWLQAITPPSPTPVPRSTPPPPVPIRGRLHIRDDCLLLESRSGWIRFSDPEAKVTEDSLKVERLAEAPPMRKPLSVAIRFSADFCACKTYSRKHV